MKLNDSLIEILLEDGFQPRTCEGQEGTFYVYEFPIPNIRKDMLLITEVTPDGDVQRTRSVKHEDGYEIYSIAYLEGPYNFLSFNGQELIRRREDWIYKG